jgi:hypothetical protein
VHRPRGGAALRQAWVPRVVNLTFGALLLAFLVPLWAHLRDVALSVQILLVFLAVPLSLLALSCLATAARPGVLRRLRRRH